MDPRTRTLVVRDSHVRRLRKFMQHPPDHFTGNVQLSLGLDGDMDFLCRGGRKSYQVQTQDKGVIKLNSPHVVVLMVGRKDLCHPSTSSLEVASTIHDLALSIADMEGCHWVFVASIPPRRSYALVSPVYPERVYHCNSILKDLLQVEKGISYFKLRGFYEPQQDIFIRDSMHFNGYVTYKMYMCRAWSGMLRPGSDGQVKGVQACMA